MMTWDKQFCSLALGLIVYDYYSAVDTNTTTSSTSGGINSTDDLLSAHSGAAAASAGAPSPSNERYKKMVKRKGTAGSAIG